MFEKVLPVLTKLENENSIKNKFKYAKLYATCKDEGAECLVFNDLTVEGYEMKDRRLPVDLNHALAVVKNYAKLHSLSFVLKKRNVELFKSLSDLPETFFCERFLLHYQKERMSLTLKNVLTLLDEEKEKDIADMVKEATKNLVDIFDFCLSEESANGYTVINHGDGWINNIFFQYEVK